MLAELCRDCKLLWLVQSYAHVTQIMNSNLYLRVLLMIILILTPVYLVLLKNWNLKGFFGLYT